VETWDNGTKSDSRIVLVEDAGSFVCYATISREIRIIDLLPDHREVLAEIESRKPKADDGAA